MALAEPTGFPNGDGSHAAQSARSPALPIFGLFVALQFLTRLPSPVRREPTPTDVGGSVGWFPVVGIILGLLLLAVDATARRLFADPVVDALLVALLAAATGALHLDGLIDAADGLSAGPDPPARLAAMRRAAAGVPGAVAGCTMVLASYVALGALGGARSAALLLAPVCGRTAIVLGYYAFPYGRPEPTVSRSLKDGATRRRALAGAGAALIFGGIVAGPGGVALVALTATAALVLGRAVLRRLPGLTGDIHGAICETTQLVAFLAAPLLIAR